MTKGFTLIELMITVVILAILVAIALPSYQQYARKNNEKIAEQKLKEISLKLENERSTNFSYKGFSLATEDTVTPKGKTGGDVKYNIAVDKEVFQKWVITACVNTDLDDADKYNNFALNNSGSTCVWKENKTCTIPSACVVK